MRIEELPNGQIRVALEAPIANADGDRKTHVTLRPPTCGEVLDHGEPNSFVVTGRTMGVEVDDPEIIRKYLSLLIVDHDIEIIQKRGAISDALALRDAVKRFFDLARKKLLPSPAPSSSTGESTPSPSNG